MNARQLEKYQATLEGLLHEVLPSSLNASDRPLRGEGGQNLDTPTQRGPRNVHGSSTGFGRKTPSPKQIPHQQINHEIYRNYSFIYYFNLQRSDSGRAIKGEITLREGLAINGAYISKACAYDQLLRPWNKICMGSSVLHEESEAREIAFFAHMLSQ